MKLKKWEVILIAAVLLMFAIINAPAQEPLWWCVTFPTAGITQTITPEEAAALGIEPSRYEEGSLIVRFRLLELLNKLKALMA